MSAPDGPIHRRVQALESAAAESAAAAEPGERPRFGIPVSFRVRMTVGLIASAVLPLIGFGAVLILLVPWLAQGGDPGGRALTLILAFAIGIAAVFAVLVAYVLSADLTAPLRAIAEAVDRVSSGDLATPLVVPGDDELARLADSHNRLAADLERRNRELGRILAAIETTSPRDGVESLTRRAAYDAQAAFGMIDAEVYLVDPRQIPTEEPVPGDPRPVRAEVRSGGEPIGVLIGHLPATRRWERADQDLLELFVREVGVAVRNAQLFAQVETQNSQLRELDAAKDDFLRGVSHNLQTPLASIRAYAEQLEAATPDRRLGIISEQADRLSRMVRQLLTVTRLESGALRPRSEVLALAPRVKRTWEALAAPGIPLALTDRSGGWLAVGDPDQLDQVLWALLDNSVKYGLGRPIEVDISIERSAPAEGGPPGMLRLTIADHGPGVSEEDRERLFARFERGSHGSTGDGGSGLGLYVSRELARAMGGDLMLEPREAGLGAAFSILLPGEPPDET